MGVEMENFLPKAKRPRVLVLVRFIIITTLAFGGTVDHRWGVGSPELSRVLRYAFIVPVQGIAECPLHSEREHPLSAVLRRALIDHYLPTLFRFYSGEFYGGGSLPQCRTM